MCDITHTHAACYKVCGPDMVQTSWPLCILCWSSAATSYHSFFFPPIKLVDDLSDLWNPEGLTVAQAFGSKSQVSYFSS